MVLEQKLYQLYGKIKSSFDESFKGFPAIFSDIDGVLVKGSVPIEGTIEALKFWRQPLS